MRLLVLSDLHLEFGPFEFPTALPDFDVAVFAGDIHQPVSAAIEWLVRERDTGSLQSRPVIYVTGNHEFYNCEMHSSLAEGERLAEEAGIHLLHRRAIVINGVRFLGCTLWTDYRLYAKPKQSMVHAGHTMNDHRLIRYREETGHISRFMPWHAAAVHRLDLAFLRNELAQPHDGPTVVVTHHAPHPGSIQPQHRGSPLAPAFVSDLSELIETYRPELWVHGHDHGNHDYCVGNTRIFANQAGYPHRSRRRENPGFRPDCIVEIGDADPDGHSDISA